MSFIEVELSNWNCDKVTVGIPPKGKEPTILYDEKIPILKLCSDKKNKYIVSSYKGLQRNMTYDKKTESFLDTWEGDWSISFQVAASYAQAEAEQGLSWKIIKIFQDIESKLEDAYGTKPNPSLNFGWIKEKNKAGVIRKTGIDETKGVYIKGKVSYSAPKDCEKMIVKGKEVPILAERVPKTLFFDITRSQKEMCVKNPDIECQTAMNAVPKLMIGTAVVNEVLYVTKRLQQCYYEPITTGGDAPDEELIAMLRENLDISSESD